MKKKILFLLIIIIAIMFFVCITNSQAAFIGRPEDLANALGSATYSQNTVTLTGNATLGEYDYVDLFDDIVLDLNGFSLENNGMMTPIMTLGNITIKNGTLDAGIVYWGTLNVENATLKNIDGQAESFTNIKGNSTLSGTTLGNLIIENNATLVVNSNNFKFGYHNYNENGHLCTNNGTILVKDSNSKFTMDSGNNILNNGQIVNNGTFTNNGQIVNYGIFTNNGIIPSESTGEILENPYKIIIEDTANGEIKSGIYYSLGEELITLTIVPNSNCAYKDETLRVMNVNNEIELTKVNNTTYTFTMPEADVNVTAEFIKGYEEKTISMADEDFKVSLNGVFYGNPVLAINKIEKGNSGYDSLIARVEEDKKVIGSYDISISGGGYTGKLELTFNIGEQYVGNTITIYHKLASGEIETKTAIVKDGKAIISINELSPFMLVVDNEVVNEKDETPKTGNNMKLELYGAMTLIILSIGVIYGIKKVS